MTFLLLLVGLASITLAAPILVVGARDAVSVGRVRRDAFRFLDDERDDGPFRPSSEMTRRMADVGGRLTPDARLATIRSLVVRSGSSMTVDHVLSLKAFGLLLGAGVAVLSLITGAPLGALSGSFLAAAGWLGPDVVLRKRAEARGDAIRMSLSDALDLLAISVEAGAGLEGAMARVATDLGGPLSEELRRLLREMRLGTSRREALLAFKERVDLPEVSSFVLALVQADTTGMAMSHILKVQADEMRARRRRQAREKAGKTPVKILFPLVFGIFPSLMLVVMGPAVLRIFDTIIG